MSVGPDSPERDPALERAWRAHSREGPPPELDRAILAASHRAVGSGPQEASKAAREATRPQRWWMPLAAAATIGVIAVGLLQLTPPEQSLVAPNERVAAVARRGADEKPPAPAVSPSADSAMKERDAAAGLRDGIADSTQKKKQEVPATPASAPAKPAAPVERERPAITGKLAARAPEPQAQPQPFPAAAADDARKNAAGEVKRDAPREAAAQAADSFAQAPAVAQQAPRAAMAEAPAASRKDATRDRQQLAAATDKATESAQPGRAARASEGATSSFAAAPPAAAPPGARESGGARSEAPAPMQAAPVPAAPAAGVAAPPALAKTLASTEELRAKARDPDAWIVRIRKLRDEGNTVEAMRELREFRNVVPDAERRLPADLVAWASTVK